MLSPSTDLSDHVSASATSFASKASSSTLGKEDKTEEISRKEEKTEETRKSRFLSQDRSSARQNQNVHHRYQIKGEKDPRLRAEITHVM